MYVCMYVLYVRKGKHINRHTNQRNMYRPMLKQTNKSKLHSMHICILCLIMHVEELNKYNEALNKLLE